MGLFGVGILLLVGYFTGRYFEQRHYQSIIKREAELRKIPVISSEWKENLESNCEYKLYGGSVVIGSDYFKTFVTGLRNIFGGRMHAFESLIDRGRREAILRMKEKADRWGAEKIVNLRIETSTVGNTPAGGKGITCVEIFAYGTAVRNKNGQIYSKENP